MRRINAGEVLYCRKCGQDIYKIKTDVNSADIVNYKYLEGIGDIPSPTEQTLINCPLCGFSGGLSGCYPENIYRFKGTEERSFGELFEQVQKDKVPDRKIRVGSIEAASKFVQGLFNKK
ncbi:hypothetical protein [Brevibacillus borstelensis]|uniref:hypothetical protein n=1 Tax=Brevibacillus borstelensis TaxID=45462 RepID=UPI0030C5F9FE